MNIEQLKEHLKALDIRRDSYSLGRDSNEALCLLHESTRWSIYYSQKGQRCNERLYYDEQHACDAFLVQIKHMMSVS